MQPATNPRVTCRPGGDATQDDAELIGRALATEGGHLSIGRYGTTLHYARGCALSGYDPDRLKAACLAAGLPVIDTRPVPIQHLAELALCAPLVAVGEPVDPQPWHALAKAPLAHVAALYRAAGAAALNLPTNREEAGEPDRRAP